MRLIILLVVVGSLAVGFLTGQAVTRTEQEASGQPAEFNAAVVPASNPSLPAPAAIHLPEGLTANEERVIEVFRQASDSVVYITSIALRRNFFSLDVMQIPQGSGSGFVWDKQGHIVTNYHVIEGGTRYAVTLSNQSTWEAEVVGTAADKDLAVLKIVAEDFDLKPLARGTSSELVVGQSVLAVGNPFGLDHTLTVGVVSALGRELRSPNGRTIRDVIQSDAAINPGNSGGPLLDSSGQIVGVNSAIYSPSGASAGIGFAVPVDTVRRLVPQLIKYGRVQRVGIGVQLLPDNYSRQLDAEGVVVYKVTEGLPADRAGLLGLEIDRYRRIEMGDQIVAVDGNKVATLDDILHLFEQRGEGEPVTLTVVRNGERRPVSVRLVALQ